MAKKKKTDTFEPNLNPELEFEPKKKVRSPKYSIVKGHNYERQIVNELKELTGNDTIGTSRSESKLLDNMKVDIFNGSSDLPCYFQLKKTQNVPQIKKINAEVGKTDLPLAIIWNVQEKKEGNTNITSCGEYSIITKDFFYKLIKVYIDHSKNDNQIKE